MRRILTLLLLAGCEAPTQLVVLVGSDLTVPAELTVVEASVRVLEEPRWSHGFDLTTTALPFSFGVEPISDRPETQFEVVLTALDAEGLPRLTRSTITWVIEGEALLLPLFLASRCYDAPECGAGETCTENGCAPALVDPLSLPQIEPGEELDHDFGAPPRELDTVIVMGPAPVTNTTTATFVFEARGRAATGFECAVGEEAFAPCVSPLSINPQNDGSHRFTVRALAGDELDATPAERRWILDTVRPVTRLALAPVERTDDRTARFEFSSDEEATFECSFDEEAWAACTSPIDRTDMTLGEHRFRVRAVDAASNVEETSISHVWTIYTFVGGELFGSETWSLDKSPFAIQSTVRVPVGFSLTIEAGARVDAGVADDIQIYGGTLTAVGTSERPIRFRDVRLSRSSPLSIAVGTIRVEFAEVEGGGVAAPSGDRYDRVLLRDSILRRTARVDLAYPGGDSSIERNVFMNAAGIDIKTNDGKAFIRNNVFIDLTTDYAVRVTDSAGDAGKVIIEHNSFMNTAQVHLRIAGTAARADAPNNFWNTVDPVVIEQMIWDQRDTADVSHVVLYDPFLADHHDATPR